MDKQSPNEMPEWQKAWKQATDEMVIQAMTKNWAEYSPSVQIIIEQEAKNRELWDTHQTVEGTSKSIFSVEGELEKYVCKHCKGNYLNPATGRCGSCDLQADGVSYCKECNKFFSMPPGQLCPIDRRKLIRNKAATGSLRFGNLILDTTFLYASSVLVGLFVFVPLASLGVIKPEFFDEIDPVFDYGFGYVITFLYYFFFESIWQRTPAKFITGTKVVTYDGTKPKAGTIALRTLIRFVPFEAFSFLGQKVYGWHDSWSKTYVVKSGRFGSKKATVKKTRAMEKKPPPITTPLERECGKEKELGIQIANYAEVVLKDSQPEKPSTGTKAQLLMLGRLEKCANCDRTIGKLEHSYRFRDHIVCTKCYQRLKSQE